MSDSLNALIDNYLKAEDSNLFPQEKDSERRAFFIDHTKNGLREEITKEIKEEVYDEAMQKAKEEIKGLANAQKVKDIKGLLKDGFIVAILVGLLVNQATEAIGFIKDAAPLSSIWSTIILVIFLLVVCILVFIYMFVSGIVSLVKKENHDEGD